MKRKIVDNSNGENLEFQFDLEKLEEIKLLEYKGGYFDANYFVNHELINQFEFADFDEFEFDDEKSGLNDKVDYVIAVSSGIIASAIDIFNTKDFSLSDAQNWGRDKSGKFIVFCASKLGCKKDDLDGSIRYLEDFAPLPSDKNKDDFGGGLQHHLRDFAHHPTVVGLLCSILGQFTHKSFGTDTNGAFIVRDTSDSKAIGKTIEEKIFNGTIIWIIHLISDMDGSSNNPGKGTGIPGPFLSLLKELSAFSYLFADGTSSGNKNSMSFPLFVSKLFNGTLFKGETPDQNIRFDFRTELGVLSELSWQVLPVAVNECIVRGVYALRQLCKEIKEKDITSFKELNRVNLVNVLPYRSKRLNRMLTVASGTFSVIDIAHALICANIDKTIGSNDVFKSFLLKVNVVGIGRFAVALKVELNSLVQRLAYKNMDEVKVIPNLSEMTLDLPKARIMYSLEYLKCALDIAETENLLTKKEKIDWLLNWESELKNSVDDDKFEVIKDVSDLIEYISSELNKTKDDSWVVIISLELNAFKPYYALGVSNDKKYKKLKYTYKHYDDNFCNIQNYIKRSDLSEITGLYSSYINKITGKTNKIVGSIAVTLTATVATAGVFLYFAPAIAVSLVGGGMTLHGAALVNASLAMIGGGALAVGGLGMVGGTAILTGGGALIGLISSASVVASANIILSNSNFTLNECSKLLTFVKYVFLGKRMNYQVVEELVEQIDVAINNCKKYADTIEDGSDKRKFIKNKKMSLMYLQKTKDIMIKELDKFKEENDVSTFVFIENEYAAYEQILSQGKISIRESIISCRETIDSYIFSFGRPEIAGNPLYAVNKYTGMIKITNFFAINHGEVVRDIELVDFKTKFLKYIEKRGY